MSKLKIPESWAELSLSDLPLNSRGQAASPKDIPANSICLVEMEDIEQNTGAISFERAIPAKFSTKNIFAKGDVLYGKLRPYLNKCGVAKVGGICSSEIFVLKTSPIDPKFVAAFLRSNEFVTYANGKVHGARMPRLSREQFGAAVHPLPPLAEQKRIVAKIESTQEKVQAIESSISKAEELIEKYRESLLQKAFRGELVQQDPNDEPASKLIERIRAEKAKQSDGKKKKKDELPPIKPEEIPFEIPKSWEWVRLGELVSLLNGDRGANYPNVSEYVKEGIPWINTGHIEPDGSLSAEDMHFITRKKFDSLRSGKIEANDLVYCLRGATLGKTAFVRPYKEGAIASSLVILRPRRGISPDYLYSFLTSSHGKHLISRFDNGSAQPNLSANSVGLYVLPLPPLDEQMRIVRQLVQMKKQLSSLKSLIAKSRDRINTLNNSILQSAFSGQLVPQQSNEGTGHELLEKIKSEQPQVSEDKPAKKASIPENKKRAKK